MKYYERMDMRKKFLILFEVFLGLSLLWTPSSGMCSSEPQIQVDARSAILVEVNTGKVLFEQNADLPIGPASFTKLITLYLAFEGIEKGLVKPDDEVRVSEKAWRTEGSRMFLEVGSRVPFEEIIKGIAVISGNDACVAVAEHLHGSVDVFVEEMNRKAREIGMKDSTFRNPHGLSAEGQVTTARDMTIFAIAYIRRFPKALQYHSMLEYTHNKITQYNRNRLLLRDKSVDGLKTGYVSAAGHHLAATAKRDGMRLLAVVMGASSATAREGEATKLLEYGFNHYTLLQPFPLDKPLATLRVWKGVKNELPLYPLKAPELLVSRRQQKNVYWETVVPDDVSAPIHKNQSLGRVVLYLDNQTEKTVALISHEEVAKAGWLKQIWHGLLGIHLTPWRWIGGLIGLIVLVFVIMVLLSKRSLSRFRSGPRL
jgi:D-alanyl-D-alanine carboxypeptidase (penicillin-binding protein 5/6)